jgi:hypothetical protein
VVLFVYPETKGVSLEQMQQKSRNRMKGCSKHLF